MIIVWIMIPLLVFFIIFMLCAFRIASEYDREIEDLFNEEMHKREMNE